MKFTTPDIDEAAVLITSGYKNFDLITKRNGQVIMSFNHNYDDIQIVLKKYHTDILMIKAGKLLTTRSQLLARVKNIAKALY